MRTGLPKRILFPTDFTDTSQAALKQAAAVAESCSAELVVLYADQFIPPLDVELELPNNFIDLNEKEKKEVVENYLKKEVAAIVPPGVHVDPVVVIGSPVPAILQTAKEKDADWIVMGTHGRSGFQRLVEGSVTEEVLRHADRPVLALHATA